ncbi:MAG: hypothetical protein LW809_03395 [Vampirovibrionales bacterium]|jgi:hypothetical protein|nr:hypothetical protein [Vampirovibrionales bacterium]
MSLTTNRFNQTTFSNLQGTYNLLKDKNIQLNAEHKSIPGWQQPGGVLPWVTKKIDMLLGDQQLILDDNGNATLNGKALEKEKPFTTKDGSVLKWNGTELIAENTNNGEYNMKFTVNTLKDANGQDVRYIDTDLSSTAKGVNSDGVMPTGILGEGFDADAEVRLALKKAQASYLLSEADKLEASAKVKAGESQVADETAKTAKALAQTKASDADFAQFEANKAFVAASDADSNARAAAALAALPNAPEETKVAAATAQATADRKRIEANEAQSKADKLLTEATVAEADAVSKDGLALIAKSEADRASAEAIKVRTEADKAQAEVRAEEAKATAKQ